MASYMQLADRRRALGDELLYAMGGRAACKAQSAWWVSCERDLEWAETVVEARAAAAPVVEMCRSCPVLDLCELWAVLERYSGLAAGHAWEKGRKRDPMVPMEDPAGWVGSRASQLEWRDLQELVRLTLADHSAQVASGGEVR